MRLIMSNTTAAPAVLLATAPVVRAAYKAGKFPAAEGVSLDSLIGAKGDGNARGRINPAHVKSFLASKAGKGYTMPNLGNGGDKAPAPSREVSVPRVKTDAKGRKRTLKPVTLPMAEVRRLAGVEGKKGRLSQADIAKAGAALVAAMPAPKSKA